MVSVYTILVPLFFTVKYGHFLLFQTGKEDRKRGRTKDDEGMIIYIEFSLGSTVA